MRKSCLIVLAILISLFMSEARLNAYVCAGREKAEADYALAQSKIKEIAKERQLWTMRLQSWPSTALNSLSDVNAMLSLSKTCDYLDGYYNDEYKKAYWKWAKTKWGRNTTDWLPDLFKGTADYEQFNKDFANSYKFCCGFVPNRTRNFPGDFYDLYTKTCSTAGDGFVKAMQELRGKGFKRASDYLDQLDRDQDQWTKFMREAHKCMSGTMPPATPVPSGNSTIRLTVSGLADTKYARVNQSVSAVVLISGGTPPYNFSLTSPVHNMNFAPLPESTYSRSYGGSQELHIPLEFTRPGNYSVTFVAEDSSFPRQYIQQTKVIIVEDDGSTSQPETISLAIEGKKEAKVGERVTLHVKGGKPGFSYIWKIRDNLSGRESKPSRPLGQDTYTVNASREGNFWVTVQAVRRLRSGGTTQVGTTALHPLKVKRERIPMHIEANKDKFTIGDRMEFKAVIDDPNFSRGAAPQGSYAFAWKVDNKPASVKTSGDNIVFSAKTEGPHTVEVELRRVDPRTLKSSTVGDASKAVTIVKKAAPGKGYFSGDLSFYLNGFDSNKRTVPISGWIQFQGITKQGQRVVFEKVPPTGDRISVTAGADGYKTRTFDFYCETGSCGIVGQGLILEKN